jgi:hypothetical protein
MAWWNHHSTLSILSECCICHSSAAVAFPALQTLYRGEFEGLSDRELTLRLLPNDSGDFHTDCLCCVTFNYEYRPHVFLSSVLSHGGESVGTTRPLTLEVPAQILVENRRIAFRVPVDRDSGLRVWVTTRDGQTWTPETRNLSVAGMLVEFDRAAAPRLEAGDLIEVLLQMAAHEIRLEAEVKRRDGDAYGLFFPKSLDGRKLRPPADLDAIVRALDRQRRQLVAK